MPDGTRAALDRAFQADKPFMVPPLSAIPVNSLPWAAAPHPAEFILPGDISGLF